MCPRRPLLWLLLATVTALSVASCGGGEASDSEGPTLVATTGFTADLARGVAGDDADVVQLVPDSANPHNYSASAKDRATLAEADLIVAVGHNYEEGLPLDEVEAPRFAMADEVGSADPHVWLDPTRMAAAAPRLAKRLARADPGNADAYRERASDFAGRMRKLDAEVKAELMAIPRKDRKLVTSHESLGHFAARYGLEFVGAPFGLAPEAEASSRDVAEVIELVREEDVPAVFSQQGDDPEVMRQIASEADVKVIDDLLVENPGPQGRTYPDAMRHNAKRIAAALGG